MASLALGLALGGVGNFLLPGIGGSLGFTLGAMIGSRIGRKSHQSPQLKDLRVQTSEYGTPIPIGYGTIRIAGWCEWAAPKVAHKHKSGGKGGPKAPDTTTYTDSFAIGLLETSFLDGDGVLVNNPILGILRIWANGRLVFGDGSSADALPITIYYGTEDQLPDPTIEAAEGAGQVSANRGKAYVVFTDLELAPYGDAIPNFTFEVVASGSIDLEYYAIWPVDYTFPDDGTFHSYPYRLNGVENTAAGLVIHRYRSGDDYTASEMNPGDDLIIYYDQSLYDLQGNLISTETQIQSSFGGSPDVFGSLTSGIGYARWLQNMDCSAFGAGPVTSAFTFAWLKNGIVTYTPSALEICPVAEIDFAMTWTADVELRITAAPLYWNGNVYACGGTVGEMWVRRWPAPDGAVYTPIHDADADLYPYSHDNPVSAPFDLVLGDDGYLYCRVSYFSGAMPDPEVVDGWGVRIIRLDADLNIVKVWFDPSGDGALGGPGYSSFVIWHSHIITWASSGTLDSDPVFQMFRLNGDGSTTFVSELNQDPLPDGLQTPLIYIGGNLAAFREGILSLGNGTITLGEMVANVSQHVGYAEDEYDVSQLTDVVRGACISQRTSGRAAIEAWQPAYGFGAVESNFTNKFVKWGGDVIATIPDEDLGAREYGTEPGDPIRRTLITDKDLPRTVECIFLNKTMDYQEGMQYWEGPVKSDTHVALSMALVLTDSEGKAVAENIGVNAMVERNKFTFSLPRKWAHLEPTDVVSINEQAIRIINKDEQGYTHILMEGISTRIGEWIVAPVASEVVYVPQAPPGTIKTDLLLLDTALARDSDYQLGFNAAMAGTMAGSWPGAGLYKSVDGGATYSLITAAAEADAFGVATTALGDFGGGNIVDELNIFTVRLTPGSGDLESTNYLGLLNGLNLFALGTEAGGYELAQFRTTDLIETTSGGSKTYQLSGLLRGRRGTEWAMDTHQINDNFVLLPAHNVDGIFAELGAERLYKAVTSGSTLSSATAVEFTNNGIALKPYAPVLLGGGRNAAGDVIINWQRRSRIGWSFLGTVPLGETVEQYMLNFYTDATYTTLVYTAYATEETFTLDAADQTALYGDLENPLHGTVQQSGSYGYGYAARFII